MSNVALSCLSTAILLLLGEVVLRIWFPWGYAVSPDRQRKALHRGLHIGQIGNRVEFAIPLRMNNLNVYGPPVELDKAPGCRRVLVLGDSFIEAIQVAAPERWSTLLQGRLDRWDEHCVDMVPVGLSGTAQRWQNEMLRSWPRLLEADLVLSSFLMANDVRDNDTTLSERSMALGREYAALAEGAPGRMSRWLGHSRLWGFLRYRVGRLPFVADRGRQAALRRQLLDLDLAAQAARLPLDYERAWRATEEQYARMQRHLEGRADLRVVALPYQALFESPPRTARVGGEEVELAPGRAFERLEKLLERRSIPYNDLRTCFQRRNPKGRSIAWIDDGHWNRLGNRLAAECLFEVIASWARAAEPRDR